MEIHTIIENIHPGRFNNPVVTIGTFDGLHIGHKKILTMLKQRSEELRGDSILLTLWPHPRMILDPENHPGLLTTRSEKINLISKTGIKHVIELEFNLNLSELSAEEFIKKILLDKIGMKHLILGYNNRIGRGRGGNYENIKVIAQKYGFSIEQLFEEQIEGCKVSSSVIRKFIEQGEMVQATAMLGYYYSITGKVIQGKRLGSAIGFPTANIYVGDKDKLIPKLGSYTVLTEISDKTYQGMLNIGYRPTLNSSENNKVIEMHIFNFNGNLYNSIINISFIQRLRDEHKFDNLDQLVQQLKLDKQKAITILSKTKK